jgi:TRAP-type C4-dicarboxylate transport system permease small subunit
MKRIIEYFDAILLFCILFIIILEVVCRGVLHVPVSFTDELSRSIYIIMVFLGASAALRDRAHVTVDIVTNIVPEKAKRILRIVSAIFMIPFIVAMTFGAFEDVMRYWASVISTVGWLKVGYLYLGVAVSGILMIFYIILNLIDDIRNRPVPADKG